MTAAARMPRIEVPEPAERVDLVMGDGAVIALRRYGRPGATRVVLSHGNGLAIDAYAPFWAPLAADLDIVVLDVRNHGRNPRHDITHHTWPRIAADFEEIWHGLERHFGPATTVGAFHSLSSVAVTTHALSHPDRWHALALFDPPLFPPDGHPLQPAGLTDMQRMSARARRRPERYGDPAELAAQLAARPDFAGWVEGAHDLMARATLRPAAGGGFELACPREAEAHIYITNVDATLWPRLPTLGIPLILIAGDPASPHASPAAITSKAIHDELGLDYVMVPGTTHFLQIEQPAACRAALMAFLARHGLAASAGTAG